MVMFLAPHSMESLSLNSFVWLEHLAMLLTCIIYVCLVFVMFSRLFIAALRSPAGKGLTSWLLFVMFNCVFVTFPCGILGQVWYLIVSIPNIFAAFLTSTADNSQMQLQNYLPN